MVQRSQLSAKVTRLGPKFQLQDLLFSSARIWGSSSETNGDNHKALRADSLIRRQPEMQKKSFSWQQDLRMCLQEQQSEIQNVGGFFNVQVDLLYSASDQEAEKNGPPKDEKSFTLRFEKRETDLVNLHLCRR